MEKLAEEIEHLIETTAQEAIASSGTYNEAINMVKKFSSRTVYGLAIEKAIQAKILARALSSEINKEEKK